MDASASNAPVAQRPSTANLPSFQFLLEGSGHAIVTRDVGVVSSHANPSLADAPSIGPSNQWLPVIWPPTPAEMDIELGEPVAPGSPKPTVPVPVRRDSRGRRSQVEAARTVSACENCRQKKVKCDGQWPCKYCDKRNLTCAFNAAEKRKMFAVS
jgi:hypothetical protein